MNFEGLIPPYATLTADPPWATAARGTSLIKGKWTARGGVGYSTMSLDEIKALPVSDLAAKDAHLYLWVIPSFLRDGFDVIDAWGFKHSKTLVWCKKPRAPFMGVFGGTSLEFCQFAHRGNLGHTGKVGRQWFEWPRHGHSVKPPAFMDMVEKISPGPYLELFTRQARLGWDGWGLGHETPQ